MTLKVRKDRKFIDSSIVPNITVLREFWICIPPCFCSKSKKSNIKKICFLCVWQPLKIFSVVTNRDKVILYRIGLYQIIIL